MDGILDAVKCGNICFCLLYTFPVKNLNETNDQNKDHGPQYSKPISAQSLTRGQSSHFPERTLPCVTDAFGRQGEFRRMVQKVLFGKCTLNT